MVKIQTNKEKLTAADIGEIIRAHESDANHKRKLKRYFLAKHDEILQKPQRAENAPNNRIISNYPAYITNMSTGFFIGQPVAYKTADKYEKKNCLAVGDFQVQRRTLSQLDAG